MSALRGQRVSQRGDEAGSCTSIVRTILTPEKQVAYLHFTYLGGMRDGARPVFLRPFAHGNLVALCDPDVGMATAPSRTRSH
jgi:hypothetical protein